MASYDNFAKQYSDSNGDEGDYFHKTQIDPYVYKIIGDPKGKTVYDLGCGNGYISRNLAKKGSKVFASDISKELIKIAEEQSKDLNINYSVRNGIDFSGFGDNQFDVVVMNMVIHYIEDLDKLFKEISRVLKPNGVLAFSTNHFFRQTYPYSDWTKGYFVRMNSRDWIKDKEYIEQHKDADVREVLFVKNTNYLKTFVAKINSGWDDKETLEIVNRPLNVYINTMSKYGLYLHELYEPESPEFPQNESEDLRKSHHIPTFIIFGAIKK